MWVLPIFIIFANLFSGSNYTVTNSLLLSSTGSELIIKGSLTGTNSNMQNSASQNLAVQGATIGCNGLTVAGLIGSNAINVIAGDITVASGTGCSGNLNLSNGNAYINGNTSMTGALNVSGTSTFGPLAVTSSAGAVAATGASVSLKIPINVNGTTYYLLAASDSL